MIENAEMRIFGQISDLHQARMVREEREGMDEAKQRDEDLSCLHGFDICRTVT